MCSPSLLAESPLTTRSLRGCGALPYFFPAGEKAAADGLKTVVRTEMGPRRPKNCFRFRHAAKVPAKSLAAVAAVLYRRKIDRRRLMSVLRIIFLRCSIRLRRLVKGLKAAIPAFAAAKGTSKLRRESTDLKAL